jgi:hypothetical protein
MLALACSMELVTAFEQELTSFNFIAPELVKFFTGALITFTQEFFCLSS